MFFMDEEVIFLLLIGVTLWMFFRTRKLSNRVAYMEKYLQETTKVFAQQKQTASSVPTPHVSENAIAEEMLASLNTEEPETAQTPPQMETADTSPFIEWLKTDWLMKLGGLLLILGMAWFVNYAFVHDWIGDMGKIGLGLTVGALVLVIGRYRMNSFVSQGSILMFVGALTVVMTVWAGREFYDFFTPLSALFIMFLTSCVLGVTAVTQARLPLAYANVLLAAVAPLLTSAYSLSLTALFTYLLVLSLGAVWVAVVTGWRQLVLTSLVIVSAYSVPFLGGGFYWYSRGDDSGLMFSFIFTALFFFVSILGMRQEGSTKLYDLFTAILSGLYLLLWILSSGAEEWQVLLLVAWTLVFAFGAFIAQRLGAAIEFFYAYAGVGVVLLGVATALQLDGPSLTIAYIFESLVIIFVGYRISRKASLIPVLAIPALVPMMLSFGSMNTYLWKDSIVHEDSLVLILIMLSGLGLAQFFRTERLNEQNEEERNLLAYFSNALTTITSLYGIVYVWLASYALFGEEFGIIVSLFVYIGIGSALYTLGKRTGQKWKRRIGATLIGITSAYLLLVGGSLLGQFGRIIAYMVIGVVLISVAWHERSSTKN